MWKEPTTTDSHDMLTDSHTHLISFKNIWQHLSQVSISKWIMHDCPWCKKGNDLLSGKRGTVTREWKHLIQRKLEYRMNDQPTACRHNRLMMINSDNKVIIPYSKLVQTIEKDTFIHPLPFKQSGKCRHGKKQFNTQCYNLINTSNTTHPFSALHQYDT